MAEKEQRIVLDTNVIVRAMVQARSPSGQVLSLCEQRRAVPLLSSEILAEYRAGLTDRQLVTRFSELEIGKVERVLARLVYIGDVYRRVRVRFRYARDPKDSKFVELAIAGRATTIVTCDADLLDLPQASDEAGRRFRQRLPRIKVVRPEDYLREFERGVSLN